ncbi:hypothetical protein M427DRAFT_159014 [Gonapodya prolifera JEL478]|uniref:Alpha/beta-hydrolase n=1 Tax=Gonapodya prolifera (strain JEL478) TaxID=1344416 RepID=A0A139A1T3_GONPJ|nr:hypothetical protein M427DRAFT_159014 [Gonapodya prolifera JEL478]|eukprot:KXS10649.1 hypothetical protein M427DRAFT_159014 [Gonapodya prolifera JEL478]
MASWTAIVLFLSAALASTSQFTTAAITPSLSTWTSCGSGLDCAKLTVPLEYADASSHETATIPLVRFNATAAVRKGSILVNPGGPGASGVAFVSAGAGQSISVITGGEYDIIGFDPRGVGGAEPKFACFANAGDEYDFNSAFPAGANLWIGAFANATERKAVASSMKDFDTAAANLAAACLKQNSKALFTSSASYVVRDMASIVDALDGPGAKLNYWGFSYGPIFGVEFIQTFPNRVGRIVLDGVYDAAANAQTYVSQLPNDQISVRNAIKDFAQLCFEAGPSACTFAGASTSAADIEARFDALHKTAFRTPVVASGVPISSSILSSFLWNFFTVPPTWPLVSALIAGLEAGDASALLNVLVTSAGSAPANRSAPAVGLRSLSSMGLTCVDNAPTNLVPLMYVQNLVANLTVAQQTPWLGADLGVLSFCRNFGSKRPKLPNVGVSKITDTDCLLAEHNTTILIVNGIHDSSTPLKSAQHLRTMLPRSSRIATRGGPGHTTISFPSLGLAKTVANYFRTGALPPDGAFYPSDMVVFPKNTTLSVAPSTPTFNGTSYSDSDRAILNAAYGIVLAFIAIA